MTDNLSPVYKHQDLYDYIIVMDNEQIWKLRKIAIGVLREDAFSEQEIALLEAKLLLSRQNN